jgi:hypothetical protein
MHIRCSIVLLIATTVIATLDIAPAVISTSVEEAVTVPAIAGRPQPAVAPLTQVAAGDSPLRWFRRLYQRAVQLVQALRWRPRLVVPIQPSDPAQQGVVDYLRAHDRVDPPADLPPDLRRPTCPALWSRTFDHWLSRACD